MHKAALVVALAVLIAACTRPGPQDTPLPTKERTIGRVQQQLEKADEEAARRREEVERAGR